MISYKLTKQLKKAGFPVIDYTVRPLVSSKGKEYFGFISPTLSELIEACGDKFTNLLKGKETFNPLDMIGLRMSDSYEWHAIAKYEGGDSGFNDVRGHGKTPEEAVAKLWLGLNQDEKPNQRTNT